MIDARRLQAVGDRQITVPGGYYLSKSPLLRNESAFNEFKSWLLLQMSDDQ